MEVFQVLRIVVIVVHALQLFISNECNYPLIYPVVVLVNTPFFVIFTVRDHLMSKTPVAIKELDEHVLEKLTTSS